MADSSETGAQAGASPGASEENKPAAGKRQYYPFEFHGQATEYFKIWIVNVLLTVLTLGIYSAWAKVRTMRYFYGHTVLDNSSFDIGS